MALRKLPQLFVRFGFTAAVVLLLLPSIADSAAEIREEERIERASEAVLDEEEEVLIRMREDAATYNARIAAGQKASPFYYRGENASDPVYRSLLSADEEGTMAVLEIPVIGVRLPVLHGTGSAGLLYAAGHMYGTSLPVGGSSSHAVLAGHTGLTSAKLFTDLTDLQEGDLFLIRVLGETHIYRIVSKLVILPEEESAYLQVEEGRDLITLYTCTPYGINDHRLLVIGERAEEEEGSAADSALSIVSDGRAYRAAAVFRIALCAAVPCLLLLLFHVHDLRSGCHACG